LLPIAWLYADFLATLMPDFSRRFAIFSARRERRGTA
jgi:hypothetical protein